MSWPILQRLEKNKMKSDYKGALQETYLENRHSVTIFMLMHISSRGFLDRETCR